MHEILKLFVESDLLKFDPFGKTQMWDLFQLENMKTILSFKNQMPQDFKNKIELIIECLFETVFF